MSEHYVNFNTEEEQKPELSTLERVKLISQYYYDLATHHSVAQTEMLTIPDKLLEQDKSLLQRIETVIDRRTQELADFISQLGIERGREGTIKYLCEQLTDFSKHQDLLHELITKAELNEFSRGLIGLKLPYETFEKLFVDRRTPQAVAFIRGRPPFIIIPHWDIPDHDPRSLKENIPHELHHILWNFLRSEGIVKSDEVHPEFAKAFLMFQDEAIARMVGGGRAMGYSHLAVVSSEYRERLEQTEPGVIQRINETVGALNGYLIEEIDAKRRRSSIKSHDLIAIFMMAKNFEDLKQRLQTIEKIIEGNQLSEEEPEKDTQVAEKLIGWGSA